MTFSRGSVNICRVSKMSSVLHTIIPTLGSDGKESASNEGHPFHINSERLSNMPQITCYGKAELELKFPVSRPLKHYPILFLF